MGEAPVRVPPPPKTTERWAWLPGPWGRSGMWAFATVVAVVGGGVFAWSWQRESSLPAPEWVSGWTDSFETTWWPGWWPLLWCLLLLLSMLWVASVKQQYGENFYQTMAGPVLCIAVMTLPPPLVVVVGWGIVARASVWRRRQVLYRGIAQIGFDCLYLIPLAMMAQTVSASGGVLNWRALVAAMLTAVGIELLPFALVKVAVRLETGSSPMPWRMAFYGVALPGTHVAVSALAVAVRGLGPFWMVVLLASVLTWQGILQSHSRMRRKIHEAEMERTAERTQVTRAILRRSETERTATMAALHDGVIQSLLVAQFQAEMRKEELELNPEQAQAWDDMVGQLSEVGRELRTLMRARGGPGAGHLDLPEALAEAMTLLPASLAHSLEVASLPAGADPGAQRAMYDIVRAGLDRVVEDGSATEVRVDVAMLAGEVADAVAVTAVQAASATGDLLEAVIVDDGQSLQQVSPGPLTMAGQLGLAMMMEMAAAREGEVLVQERPDGLAGNLVRVRLPMGDASSRSATPESNRPAGAGAPARVEERPAAGSGAPAGAAAGESSPDAEDRVGSGPASSPT